MTIPYAGGPTVGCLSASEEGGVVTVTARLTRDRAWRLIRVQLAVVVAASFLVSAVAIEQISALGWTQGAAISATVFALACAISAVGAYPSLCVLRNQPSWQASPTGLRIRARSPTRAQDLEFSRDKVALLVVDRFKVPPAVKYPKLGVRLLLPGGHTVGLYFGSRAECEFMCAELSRGLKVEGWLPRVPPRPTSARAFGVEKGVYVSVPARRTLLWVWGGGVLTYVGCMAAMIPILDRQILALELVAPMVPATMLAFAISALLRTYARRAGIWIDAIKFSFQEAGLGASADSIPTGDIEEVAAGEGALQIRVKSKPPINLLRSRPQWEREWIAEVLREGLARSRATLVA